MKRLCTVCARGGSKGVEGKNLRLLQGKPLLVWTLEQARDAGLFDFLAVSSDSEAILDAARSFGVDLALRRPDALSSDQAAKVPAIVHAVRTAEAAAGETFDVTVDLDATAPLRLPADIRGAVELLEARGVSSVITGSPARRSPYFNLVERQADGSVVRSKPLPQAIVRRQDAPVCFDMNASIYVWRRDALLDDPRVLYPDTLLYEMPEERSHDIDTPLDFEIVEFLMSRLQAAQ